MFEQGDVIDGKYRVIDEIGRGGMGAVLRVRSTSSPSEVALKYCVETDQEALRRFAREIRFMAGLSHLHVMRVLDHNLSHSPPYLTMPIAVSSLAAEVEGGLSEENALDAFKQICFGVQAIHNANGTHRDLKPHNALRMQDQTVVVSDLGLVKIEPRDTTVLTPTSAFVGTRIYCAPEQLAPRGSRNADVRTDVYQLGKTLYEMVVGEPPALIDRNRIPLGLAYIIERATQQHPDQRYQSVGALI